MEARRGGDAGRAGGDAEQRLDRARQLQQRGHHQRRHVGAGPVSPVDRVDVEPETFRAASQVFGDTVYQQLTTTTTALENALQNTGAMAGSDPAGTVGTVFTKIGEIAQRPQ